MSIDLHRPEGAVTGIAENAQGRLCRQDDPYWTDPSLDDVKQELLRIGDLLERLVALEEERRAGERQMEELGAMLAGGDSQASEITDQHLIDTHYRERDGSYWIAPEDGSRPRPATTDEARRLEQLVGRRKRAR